MPSIGASAICCTPAGHHAPAVGSTVLRQPQRKIWQRATLRLLPVAMSVAAPSAPQSLLSEEAAPFLTMDRAVLPEGAEQPEAAAAATAASFDWFRQWYPVRVIEDLDPAIPHATQLLGLDLVLWRDRSGAWRCFEDRCPHRLAALSEGRIDEKSGDLYCNYHGWQFNGAGQCTRIPQLSAEQQQGPQVRSPRACATSYPTREAEGLLWVWGRGGPGAEAEAEAAEWKGIAGALDSRNGSDVTTAGGRRWYFREIPTGFVALRENAFNDPSHDTVLHHGTVPLLDRSRAAPMTTQLKEMTASGYVVESSSGGFTSHDTAVFPTGSFRQWPQGRGVAYITPAAENRVLYFSTLILAQPAKVKPRPMFVNPLAALTNRRWLAHLRTHSLVDGDVAMTHMVNRNRAKAGGSPKLYLPAEADRGPAAFVAWMQRYGGGGPPVSTLQRPVDLSRSELPRRLLLDRFEQHTRHCRSCCDAHATLSLLASVTRLLAIKLAAAAAAACLVTFGRANSLLSGLLTVAAAGVVAAAHLALARLVRRFEFEDYDERHVSKRP